MKISWGTKIVIIFIIFAISIFILVAIAMNTKVDLVTENYYEKELLYQDHIEVLQNSIGVMKTDDIQYVGDTVRIHLPQEYFAHTSNGLIRFYRPDNKRIDFSLPLSVDSTFAVNIPMSSRERGTWKIQIEWTNNSVPYFVEKAILVQ